MVRSRHAGVGAVTGRELAVGLIGLGNSGWFYHAEGVLERSDQYRLRAVASARPERAEAAGRRFGARPYRTWQELIGNDDLDLIVIATPHHLHAEMTVAALDAGHHVVVEKPMAITRAECDRMLDAAKRNSRMLTVHQNRRWEPSYLIIVDLVRNGDLGDVWRVEERRMHRGKYVVAGPDQPHSGHDLAAWAHTREGGGGVGYLIAPHLIDHQVQLLGAPTTVSAVTHTFPGDQVEHYLDLRLGYPDGPLSRVEIFREDVVDLPKWTVLGSRGSIVCPDFNTVIIDLDGRDRRVITDLPAVRAADEFYRQLWTAITDAGPPPVDPSGAAVVTEILELAHRSARRGGAPEYLDSAAGLTERTR
ncbi:Gfo/Idh/MocA family protein [Microlunatus parietis]|uniref:Putative dehydrogenase n=1 Tax=Microlunatus parietis TaxID=682979 RepID=A0A7Y9IB72_9ACTN|nr:Gfo/Idh/MocA family oxidoreductase [Microlunatus parietis]NYE73480.1 putative dehydrogenase [Microlunatus parietis]